jgi:hypothetical protein
MSVQVRAVSAFGKRSSDEVWARSRRQQRELSISGMRLGGCLALLIGVGAVLVHDMIALLISGADRSLYLFAGSAMASLTGLTAILTAVLLLLPTALIAQLAYSLIGIGLSRQPLALVDTWGIVTPTRDGGVVLSWDEVEALRLRLGMGRLERRPQGGSSTASGSASKRTDVRVPLFLVRGGAQAFHDALAEVRPDVARRLYG